MGAADLVLWLRQLTTTTPEAAACGGLNFQPGDTEATDMAQPLQCNGSLSPMGEVTQPMQGRSSPTTETTTEAGADWLALDVAYQVHHWACPHCISAGKGHGTRCTDGAALWLAYDQAEPPARTRRAA